MRSWIKRLERVAENEVAVLVCEECGEELRMREGIELDLVADSWAQEQKRRGRASLVYGETLEDVHLINNHPCGWAALRHKGSGEQLFAWGSHGT